MSDSEDDADDVLGGLSRPVLNAGAAAPESDDESGDERADTTAGAIPEEEAATGDAEADDDADDAAAEAAEAAAATAVTKAVARLALDEALSLCRTVAGENKNDVLADIIKDVEDLAESIKKQAAQGPA